MTAISRPVHASLAVLVALAVGGGVFLLVSSAVSQVQARLDASKAVAVEIDALRARLDRAYARTDSALAAVGAAPQHLALLGDAARAQERLSAACKSLTKSETACAIEEARLSGRRARYSAKVAVKGMPAELVARAFQAATAPVRLGAWSLKAGESDGVSTLDATLLVIAAASEDSSKSAALDTPVEKANAAEEAPDAP